MTGRWPLLLGILFALVAAGCSFLLVLSRPSPPVARTAAGDLVMTSDRSTPRVRNSLVVWLASVLFFLLLFKVLDAFHIPWQKYWH